MFTKLAEKLEPTKMLDFYSSQYELVRKYKRNLEINNHVNLRIFFLILSCEYLLKIILLLAFEGNLSAAAGSMRPVPVQDDANQYVDLLTQSRFSWGY